MTEEEVQTLRKELERHGGSARALRAAFDRLVERLGADEASIVWWAVFAATDAAQT